jgi:hypothetical protein
MPMAVLGLSLSFQLESAAVTSPAVTICSLPQTVL